MVTDSDRPETTPAAENAPVAPYPPPRPESDGCEPPLVARIESYDDAPDECTIHPADVPAAELTTTWVTATEGSFVSLRSMR